MTDQIRYVTPRINFTVQGSSVDEFKRLADEKIHKVTRGLGAYDVELTITPFILKEGVVVLWQADVEARRVDA